MFSIIIAVVSIALVAILAAAVIYYGGDAFNSGSGKAKAAEIINQAEMIKGAFTAYKVSEGDISINESVCDAANGVYDGCLEPLITAQYLTDIPQGAEGWYIDGDKSLRRTVATDFKACAIANFINGADVPSNPDNKELKLDQIKNSNINEFRKYIPECSSINGVDKYICCES